MTNLLIMWGAAFLVSFTFIMTCYVLPKRNKDDNE